MTLTLNGLTPFQPYDLYLYSSGLSLESRTTSFTIGSDLHTAISTGNASVFIDGNNYVHFVAHSADSTGQLSIAVQGSGGDNHQFASPGGIVNGFQITAVPEPTVWVLASSALITFCLFHGRFLRSLVH
jgi:hypothetical protein